MPPGIPMPSPAQSQELHNWLLPSRQEGAASVPCMHVIFLLRMGVAFNFYVPYRKCGPFCFLAQPSQSLPAWTIVYLPQEMHSTPRPETLQAGCHPYAASAHKKWMFGTPWQFLEVEMVMLIAGITSVPQTWADSYSLQNSWPNDIMFVSISLIIGKVIF